ncbi:MAG: hypothetical protein QOE55_4810 [Acidobacteriaceae bacterium]|jgi:hypothetical protein|nr:hypothetical protein [Acidobacteriaceae bacterium]
MIDLSYPVVALHIMWRISVLIIWRVDCKSSVRMCGLGIGRARIGAPDAPRGSRGALEAIVCQIIRTRVSQLIRKTTSLVEAPPAVKEW